MMIFGRILFFMCLGVCFYVVHSDLCSGQNAVEECGRIPTDPNNLPWHVTIYRISHSDSHYRCFGTIVSPRIILTTENCIYMMEHDGRYVLHADPKGYEVVVNKIPRTRKSFKIKEFHVFNKTGPMVDANRFHEILMITLTEKIVFDSDVYPACVQWTDPSRVNDWNGTAMAVKKDILGDTVAKGIPSIQKFSFSSHDACKEKWTYPYYVFHWGRKIFNFGMLRLTNETFLHKKTLFCLVLGQENINSFTTGSGVLFEKDNRYYIRGVANSQFDIKKMFNGSSHETFKTFMQIVRLRAHMSSAELSEGLSQRLKNGTNTCEQLDNLLFPNMFMDLLKTPPKDEEDWSRNPQNLIGVTDLADYIDWIKRVHDLIDS